MKKLFSIVVFPILLTTALFAQETKIELPTADNTSSFTVTGTDTDRRMKFFADGGFYMTGENNVGTIPIFGAGARLMWFPGRRAFRVGAVDGAHWDLDNIGRYSMATGLNTTAKGVASTAMGYQTTASGEASTAMGYQTTVSGDYSTAMGCQTSASGIVSTAMGYQTRASGNHSTVVGRYNVADDNAMFIVGGGNSNSERKNLFKVNSDGSVDVGGDIKADGSAEIDGNVRVGGDLIADDLWTRFHGTGGTEYILTSFLGTVRYEVATFSDRRLKENVVTIASPLQKIQQLRGVTFNWNSTAKDLFIHKLKETVRPDPSLPESVQQHAMQETVDKKLDELSQTEISFIAQEVETIFPEWVTEDENGYKKIDMKGLNGLLVEAVKELKAEKDEEIAKLQKQNEDVKQENKELATRITKLEEMFAAQMAGRQ